MSCLGVPDIRAAQAERGWNPGPRCGGVSHIRTPYGGSRASRARAEALQLASRMRPTMDAAQPLYDMGDSVHYKDRKRLIMFRGYYRGMVARSEGGSGLTDSEYSPYHASMFCRAKYYAQTSWFYASQIVCRWRAGGSPDLTVSNNERRPIGDRAREEELEVGSLGQTSGRVPVEGTDLGGYAGVAAVGVGALLVVGLIK